MVEKKITDKLLGEIIIRKSNRATRYSIRIREGSVIATIPRNGSEIKMMDFICEHQDKIVKILHKSPQRSLLNEETELQALTFCLRIFRTDRTNFYATLKDHTLYIACPANTDFRHDDTQHRLRNLLEQALRKEAVRFIPVRLKELAVQYGFNFNRVSIRNTKTRWGSCTSSKNISISLSLMILPSHLVDYVLLHELCHTVEMNHGERFWQLMDKVTGGRAKDYRRQLKDYRMI